MRLSANKVDWQIGICYMGTDSVYQPVFALSLFLTVHRVQLDLQLDWTPSRNKRKIKSPMNQEDYDNSETTVGKLLTRRIQIFWVHCCEIHFIFLSKNFPNNAQRKSEPGRIRFASPNTLVQTSQILRRCLGLFENWFFSWLRKSS